MVTLGNQSTLGVQAPKSGCLRLKNLSFDLLCRSKLTSQTQFPYLDNADHAHLTGLLGELPKIGGFQTGPFTKSSGRLVKTQSTNPIPEFLILLVRNGA